MTRLGWTGKKRVGIAAGIGASLAFLASVGVMTRTNHDDRSREVREAIDGGRAKNVILFIGDGMGDSEITIARNYAVGANGRLRMDRLPLTGAYTTSALQESNPALIDYVTDSAASGTGWATGYKTSNGRISSVAGTGNAVTRFTTILEPAQRAGYKTGNVSTAELTDATPAVLNSHINDRGCQGPANMANCAPSRKENGGPGSIAEQTVDHHVNVLLGGGLGRFQQVITGGPHAGKTVVEYRLRERKARRLAWCGLCRLAQARADMRVASHGSSTRRRPTCCSCRSITPLSSFAWSTTSGRA